jgi:hypothetical protein
MSTTAIENTPITIDLVELAKTSGWTVSGSVASHESCNAGNLYVVNYPIIAGQTYKFSWQVLTCSSGYVEAFLGTGHGAQYTAPTAVITETVLAAGTNPQFYFYSNGTCSIENFTISVVDVSTSLTQQNTMSFSEKTKKWVSFYTYIPDNAFSLFTNTYSFFDGDLYVHESGTDERNKFYGVQYQSIMQFIENASPTLPKSYLSLSIQSNELMVTGNDGITTSLGQKSELAAQDFIKDFLRDGVTVYNVNTIEGIFSANLLRDKNTGTVENGDPLKGTYLICTLVSSTTGPLLLYTINIVSKHSFIGSR